MTFACAATDSLTESPGDPVEAHGGGAPLAVHRRVRA